MRTSTVQNVLKGLWAKNQQLEAEQIDGEKDQLQIEYDLQQEWSGLLNKERKTKTGTILLLLNTLKKKQEQEYLMTTGRFFQMC